MKNVCLLLIGFFCFYGVVNAQWTSSVSSPGKAICTATTVPAVKEKISITDGSNGSIVVFYGFNFINNRDAVYAQRVNSEGILQWGTELTPKDLNGDFLVEDVIPDGNNGAYISGTFDDRAGNQNVFLQHINNSGNITMQAGGVKVSNSSTGTAAVDDYSALSRLCTDGSGGVIITWTRQLTNNTTNNTDYVQAFAQKYNTTGVAAWTAVGVQLSTASGFRGLSSIVTDGQAGCILFFADTRNSPFLPNNDMEFPNLDIYAQKLNTSGARQWTDNGVPVCTEANIQQLFVFGPSGASVSDGQGGAILVFQDYRLNGNSGTSNLYAQRVNNNGTRIWANEGVLVSAANGDELPISVISNGAQGCLALWIDNRSANPGSAIYTQQIGASGSALWTTNGLLLVGAFISFSSVDVATDGTGNFAYSWDEDAGANTIIRAQKLNSNGSPLWGPTGVVVSMNDNYDFTSPEVVASDNGKLIVVYLVEQIAGVRKDIYAKKLDNFGLLPISLVEFSANKKQVIAELTWLTTLEENSSYFEIQRSNDNVVFKTIGKTNAAGNSSSKRNYSYQDSKPLAGNNYYRLKLVDRDGRYTYSAIRLVNFEHSNFISAVLLANPITSNTANIKYSAIKNGRVQLQLIDAIGRLLQTKSFDALQGNNLFTFPTATLSKGLYRIRLIDGQNISTLTMLKQ